MSVLDVWTWPRGDAPGLGFIDGYVGLLRRLDCDILTLGLIGLIKIPPRYTFFFGNPTVKNSEMKCAWHGAISECVADREVCLSVHT
jgi:hypothetical protein